MKPSSRPFFSFRPCADVRGTVARLLQGGMQAKDGCPLWIEGVARRWRETEGGGGTERGCGGSGC